MKTLSHALACALAFLCLILTAVSPAWAEDEQDSDRTLLPMVSQQDDDAQESLAAVVAQTYGLNPVLPDEYNGDLRDLSQVTFRVPRYYHMLNEFEEPEGFQPPVTEQPETLNIGLAAMPAPLANFAGLGFSDAVTGGQAGAGWPPDVNGDVGPTVYIQAVNDAYAIYNKASGARLTAFTEDSLWAASGSSTPCNGNNDGDPVVLHDAVADRWILTNFAFAFNASGNEIPPFYQCFAVSKTSDPVSGGWYLYAVQMDPGGTGLPPAGTLNDYGKFGIWTDCLYMGANGFSSSTGSYVGAIFASFSKTAMYAGSALTSAIGFISATNNPFSMFPANLLGTSAASMPPAGTPEYFISQSNAGLSFEVRKFTAGASCGAGGSISAVTNVSQTSYTRPGQNIVPQPGTTNTLDSLGDRLMQKVQYRKIGSAESLWIVHSTRTSGTSTVRPQWAQIDVTGGTIAAAPVQQQIYAPDTTLYRWMESLAVDNQGNMAVGYSVGNGTSPNFPSIAYSGRLVGDTLNNLPQTETILQAGAGFQKFGIGSLSATLIQRWGDYSAMSIDPTDDCTFWYTNEYYDTQSNGDKSNWQTRIGSFKFPTCGTTPSTFTIGGNISSLTGSVQLKLDGTSPTSTQTQTFSANGSFTFGTALASGSNWTVSVATQPTGQTCTVTNGSGTNLLANVTTVAVSCTTNTFTIGGAIGSLTGSVQLKLDGTGPTSTQTQTFSANGSFTFTTPLNSGSNWTVSVATQPTGQTCTVTNGSGTNLLANVTTVAVSCTTNKFTIGGNISSLAGSVQLKLDGTGPTSTQTQTFSTNGSFTFTTPLNSGSNWTVSVATQPTGQTCTVTNGSGTNLLANVTTVAVSCTTNKFTIGGNISSLAGSVQLKLDGTGPTSTQTQTFSTNGGFTFTTPLNSGSNWTVSVATQPTGQTCTVTNGSGTNLLANVTTVSVSCTTNTFTIGGTIGSLTGSVQLKLDGTSPTSTQTQTFSTNGGFTFTTPLNSGSNWTVSVATQPTGQTCTVTNGSGTNLLVNVTTVAVSCTTNTFTIGGTIGSLTGSVQLKLDGTSPTSTQTQTFSTNGGFTFTTPLNSGSNWTVSVATQPTGQTCTVTNGTGTNLLANVTTVSVSCTTNTFTIGGNISSLTGSVQLKLDGTSPTSTQTQTFSTNGGFTFTTPLNSGSNWTVSVATQPTGQTCTVTNGTGTNLLVNVTTVAVSCTTNTFTIGGTIGSLTGSVQLKLDGTSPTSTQTQTFSTNGGFTFTTPLNSGSNWTVSVATQPTGQTCTVTNGSGTNLLANITTISVACSANTFTLTYTAGPNGSIVGISPQTVTFGASGTAVTASPTAGYHFVQWSDASTQNPRTDTNVTADISVAATFALNQLVFTTQPADLTRGHALGTVVVTEQDGSGNTVLDNSSVDFALTACGGSLDLGSVTMVNGVATLTSTQRFYTLTSTPGLQINATTGLLGGTSQFFNVLSNSDLAFADGFEACRP